MAWNFYNREGKLLYDIVAGSAGDADTLDGTDSTGFVRIGAPGLNTGNVDIDGSVTLPLNNVAANTLLDATYRTVLVDSSAAPRTITLPNAPLTGQVYEIRDVGSTGVGNSATNNITIARANAAHRIDGILADLVISTNGRGVVLVFNGTNWLTLSDRTIATAINADTLDSLDSTQFLRSDVADTAAGTISFSEVTNFGKSTYSPVHVVQANTLLTNVHRTVAVDTVTPGTPLTVTLPAVPVVGQWYEILDLNGNASVDSITIDPNGNTIDNAGASLVITLDYDGYVLVCTAPLKWSIVAKKISTAAITAALDDLTDVNTTGVIDGALLRYEGTGSQWNDTVNATFDDQGRLHLKVDAATAGISMGDNGGVGNEVTLVWQADKTLKITGRTIQQGVHSSALKYLESGVVPLGDTYDVVLPDDSTFVCTTTTGDLFIRVPHPFLNPMTVFDGDTISAKDMDGGAGVNNFALVAEGVRRRGVPLLATTLETGTINDVTSVTTSGGIGVDEVQNFMVTGAGNYQIDFGGQVAAAVLTQTSTAVAVQNAINSLSPHPDYGYFSVSVTGINALGGLTVTFDGGTMIDGEATFTMSVPYSSISVMMAGGNWLLI